MKVLVINCGSSSLKYQVIDSETEHVLAKGLCERIGIDGVLTYQPAGQDKIKYEAAMPAHRQAVELVLKQLTNPENGILKSYMIDKLNARRMGMKVTGSGRRQSYKYAPTSRMTNTYIANGNDNPEDIIKSISNGLYAKKMGGGSVNPVTGEFNFAVSEGYIVKNGVIQEPVRGASLIGKGSEILMNIDMVGNNMTQGQGMCGSSSGSIATNVGQPMIRVKEITVGGR